jgi:hypothetical protein
MNLDILNYKFLSSFFLSFLSSLLFLIACKQTKNTKRNATKAVIQVAVKFKGSTVDNHQRVKLINISHHQNISQGPIWPAKPAS